MKIFLVWLVVSTSTNGTVTYSPPMKSLDECQALRKHIPSTGTDCISINMMVVSQQ